MKYQPFKPQSPESVFSEANILTLIRVTLSVSFFILAILTHKITYNYIGFLIHWIGDFVDGFCARKLKQETILGAEIDIIADRLEIIFFYVIFLNFRPYIYPAVMLYLIDYAFIDFYLSYQFIKFDIISPNYFYKVNKTVYQLNYSPVAKFCNSSVVTLLLIFLPHLHLLAAVFATGLIIVKTYSIFLLRKDHIKRK